MPTPVVVALGVGFFAVAVWTLTPGLSDAVRKGPRAVLSLIGLGDSAASLNREVTAVFTELRVVLADVKDASSSQAAVPKVQDLNARLVDIQRRALSAPSISPAEMEAIAKQTNRMSEAEAARKELDRIAAGRFATRELADEISLLSRHLLDAGTAASAGLMLAEATNEYEQIELERVEILKRVATAILGASDVAAMDRAAKVVEQGTRDLNALAERRKQAGGSKRDIQAAERRYQRARNSASHSTFDHRFSLAERGILSEALERAESDFQSAAQELSRETQFGFQGQASAAPPDSSSPQESVRPARVQLAPEVVVMIDSGIYKPEKGFREYLGDQTGFEAVQEASKQAQIASRPERTAVAEVVKRLGQMGQITIANGLDIRLRYAGSAGEFSRRIDFARIDSVDEGARRIQITLDRELPTKP